MIRMIKEKRGLSMVISVVLMITIAVAGVLIVAGVIIPFVKDSLNKGGSCFDTLGKIHIDIDSKYTCYDSDIGTGITRIKVNVDEVDIDGLKFVLYDEGISIPKTVMKNIGYPDIRYYKGLWEEGVWGEELELPPKNGARTYEFNMISDAVGVYPIVGRETCDTGEDNIQISKCMT